MHPLETILTPEAYDAFRKKVREQMVVARQEDGTYRLVKGPEFNTVISQGGVNARSKNSRVDAEQAEYVFISQNNHEPQGYFQDITTIYAYIKDVGMRLVGSTKLSDGRIHANYEEREGLLVPWFVEVGAESLDGVLFGLLTDLAPFHAKSKVWGSCLRFAGGDYLRLRPQERQRVTALRQNHGIPTDIQ